MRDEAYDGQDLDMKKPGVNEFIIRSISSSNEDMMSYAPQDLLAS